MVEIDAVSKMYRLYARPADRLTEVFALGLRKKHREHWALRDVTASIVRGETFCVVGENGSGKSTLLKLIAGILHPTAGTVRVHGRLTALLELGAGFNPEFTGRKNVQLNGAIHGLSSADLESLMEDITGFAEIGPYIDQPVRTYSSGMVMRLGFSVAAHLRPEILVVDEALAVGDIYFRHRSMRKIHEMKARGVTIVYVTHDTSDIKTLGDRALWLEHGRVRQFGEAREVAHQYLAALLKREAQRKRGDQAAMPHNLPAPPPPPEIARELSGTASRWGDGRARVLGVEITGPSGEAAVELTTPGPIVARVSLLAEAAIENPIIGVVIRTPQGIDLTGANTMALNIPVSPLVPGEIRTFDFHMRLPELAPGPYTITPAVADGDLDGFEVCDLVEDAVRVQVSDRGTRVYGFFRLPCATSVSRETPGDSV